VPVAVSDTAASAISGAAVAAAAAAKPAAPIIAVRREIIMAFPCGFQNRLDAGDHARGAPMLLCAASNSQTAAHP
jgi:hypothetical protein